MDVHGGFLNWWSCKSSIPIPSIPWKSGWLPRSLFVQAHVQFAPLLDGHLTIDLFKNGQTHLTPRQHVATAARKQNMPGVHGVHGIEKIVETTGTQGESGPFEGDSLGSSSCHQVPPSCQSRVHQIPPGQEATETRLELSVLSWGYPQNLQSSSIN